MLSLSEMGLLKSITFRLIRSLPLSYRKHISRICCLSLKCGGTWIKLWLWDLPYQSSVSLKMWWFSVTKVNWSPSQNLRLCRFTGSRWFLVDFVLFVHILWAIYVQYFLTEVLSLYILVFCSHCCFLLFVVYCRILSKRLPSQVYI
jgi:hypothetical protein